MNASEEVGRVQTERPPVTGRAVSSGLVLGPRAHRQGRSVFGRLGGRTP